MIYLLMALAIIAVLAFGLFMLITGVQLFAFPSLISSIVGPEDYKVIEDSVGKRKVGILFLLIPFKRIKMSDSIYEEIFVNDKYKSLMRRGKVILLIYVLLIVSTTLSDYFIQ